MSEERFLHLRKMGRELEQPVEYGGFKNFKILFVQEQTCYYNEITSFLNIPIMSMSLLSFNLSGKKKLLSETKNLIYNYFRFIEPELIVCVGKMACELFIPGIKISENIGRIFEKDKVFNKYQVCCLCKPNYFKHKNTVATKQLSVLKSYLMRNYEYGLVKTN